MVWDPAWEKIYRQQEWGKYPNEELIRFVASNFYSVKARKEVRILEVGCGPGANLWYMAREGFSVYGVDGSETAIERAKERLDRECPGWTGQLVVGDIAALPFNDCFFDAVIDNEAVYCNSYDNAKLIYNEMARVTRVGGKFFSRTFASGCWGDNTGVNVGHNAWVTCEGPFLDKGYTRFTGYNEIFDLIGGFSVIEVELLSRTMEKRKREIKEWIIIGEKQ